MDADPRSPGLTHTMEFLAEHLPPAPARLLEVGAGDGALAALLAARGYDVTALEPDEDAAARARAHGLRVIESDFLSAVPESFAYDAVLFTRSLHHIDPLDDALAHAARWLRAGGVLILEDVALETPSREDVRWLYDIAAALACAGLLREEVAERVLGAEDIEPLAAWAMQHDFDPPLHRGEAMTSAVRARFDVRFLELTPYMYRYISHWIEKTARGVAVADAVARAERRRVREGAMRAIGLRVVARAR